MLLLSPSSSPLPPLFSSSLRTASSEGIWFWAVGAIVPGAEVCMLANSRVGGVDGAVLVGAAGLWGSGEGRGGSAFGAGSGPWELGLGMGSSWLFIKAGVGGVGSCCGRSECTSPVVSGVIGFGSGSGSGSGLALLLLFWK